MIGGLVLSLGNLSTQYAWAFVGLSVTEVVSASITVVVGKFYFNMYIEHSFNFNVVSSIVPPNRCDNITMEFEM